MKAYHSRILKYAFIRWEVSLLIFGLRPRPVGRWSYRGMCRTMCCRRQGAPSLFPPGSTFAQGRRRINTNGEGKSDTLAVRVKAVFIAELTTASAPFKTKYNIFLKHRPMRDVTLQVNAWVQMGSGTLENKSEPPLDLQRRRCTCELRRACQPRRLLLRLHVENASAV
jgi:hypothetical protein